MDVCNFTDDVLNHASDINLNELLMRFLKHDAALDVCWFQSNYIKLNTGKCLVICMKVCGQIYRMTEYGDQIMSSFWEKIQTEV